MSDRRLLGFLWLVGALALWLVLRDLVQWGLVSAGLPNQGFMGGSLSAAYLYAGIATFAVALGTWHHEVVYAFCIETVQETRKVVWPTKQETRDHTVVVVITSFVFAFFLWAFDQVWKKLFAVILDLDV
jgi:preprotein translocase subunit SecE